MTVRIEGVEFGGEFEDDVQAELNALLAADVAEELPPARIKIRYMTQADDRVRPEHAALHGTVWDEDDPNRPIPPLGYGCRCYLEYTADDADTAKATGLPRTPKNPPKPGADAMQKMWAEAKMKPSDTLGRGVGKMVEEKKVKLQDVVNARDVTDELDPPKTPEQAVKQVEEVAAEKKGEKTKAEPDRPRLDKMSQAELQANLKWGWSDLVAKTLNTLQRDYGLSPTEARALARSHKNVTELTKTLTKRRQGIVGLPNIEGPDRKKLANAGAKLIFNMFGP